MLFRSGISDEHIQQELDKNLWKRDKKENFGKYNSNGVKGKPRFRLILFV